MFNLIFFFLKDKNQTITAKTGELDFKPASDFFNSLNLIDLTTCNSAECIFLLLKFVLIPLFIVLLTVLIFFLITNRYRFEHLASKKKEIDSLVNDFLTDIIFSVYDSKELKKKIAEFKTVIPFQKKWCQYMVLNKLIHFKQNVHGFDQNRILLIYKYFGLQSHSQKLIKDKRWYYKSLGIFHYQVLDYKIKKGQLKSLLKDKNKYLRSNALIATIALSDEKFGILDNYTEKISMADELKILDIIYQKKSKLPKNITKWISHENNSIVILALKLMIRYKEALTIPQIKQLLLNTDVLVRKETLLAIRELTIYEANDILINHYPKETNKRNKISCLKTLGIIGNQKTVEFASQILTQENDLEIKFEIVSCINKIDQSYFKNFTSGDSNEDYIIDKIVLHATNPYLN
ncbi:hypothetical protein FEDK69T_00840 [Flavobacterium enshiense DK69]|uniref:HEAT repeat-containing protein n=1 Tax=Flavobacterium enshiense DK69 TaxID=1107311 RepID=V6SFT1_9FLAO|nr:HEAT repeat domain-containing protein [Flavobacterium enshiense]ESU25117.1 hypothetical protein FEDK69T_00840 [Flavobacterium enshiense DK69]KGO96986.1 hypothetical protein Q767_04635 [Flavobacterium enshiense DK69]